VVAAGINVVALSAGMDVKSAGRFDFVLTTVNVKLDWNLYLSALKPKGRWHFVGATL